MWSACLHNSWTRPGRVSLGSTGKLHVFVVFRHVLMVSLRLQSCPYCCEYLARPYASSMHPSSFQGHACTVIVAHSSRLAGV